MAINELIIQGELYEVSEIERGVSSTGNNWEVRTFVVKLPPTNDWEQFVSFSLFGSRANDITNFALGEQIIVRFSATSRKSQKGRWFTDLRAYRIERLVTQPMQGQQQYIQQPPAPGYQQAPAPGYQQPPAPGYQQPQQQYPHQPQQPYTQQPQQPYTQQPQQQGYNPPQPTQPLGNQSTPNIEVPNVPNNPNENESDDLPF